MEPNNPPAWRNDPRLAHMDPQKLDLLILFSNRIAQMPKSQLLGAFMDLTSEIQKKGLQFTDQETELIAEILTEHLSEGDKQKLDTLRMLSRKLSKQK